MVPAPAVRSQAAARAAGLLAGKHAACHWAWRDLSSPFGTIVDEGRVVQDGNIITGGGVAAGIGLALAVVATVAGPFTAQAIQLRIEYAPVPPFNTDLPELAPPDVLDFVKQRIHATHPARLKAVQTAVKRLQPSRRIAS